MWVNRIPPWKSCCPPPKLAVKDLGWCHYCPLPSPLSPPAYKALKGGSESTRRSGGGGKQQPLLSPSIGNKAVRWLQRPLGRDTLAWQWQQWGEAFPPRVLWVSTCSSVISSPDTMLCSASTFSNNLMLPSRWNSRILLLCVLLGAYIFLFYIL